MSKLHFIPLLLRVSRRITGPFVFSQFFVNISHEDISFILKIDE